MWLELGEDKINMTEQKRGKTREHKVTNKNAWEGIENEKSCTFLLVFYSSFVKML